MLDDLTRNQIIGVAMAALVAAGAGVYVLARPSAFPDVIRVTDNTGANFICDFTRNQSKSCVTYRPEAIHDGGESATLRIELHPGDRSLAMIHIYNGGDLSRVSWKQLQQGVTVGPYTRTFFSHTMTIGPYTVKAAAAN